MVSFTNRFAFDPKEKQPHKMIATICLCLNAYLVICWYDEVSYWGSLGSPANTHTRIALYYFTPQLQFVNNESMQNHDCEADRTKR